METTFAVTGVHRKSLKNYRPSFHRTTDLDPIYEDKPIHQLRHSSLILSSKQNNGDYVFIPNNMQNGDFRYRNPHDNQGFEHNYEEIDATTIAKLESRRMSLPAKTASSMLHNIMNNRINIKRKYSNSTSRVQNFTSDLHVSRKSVKRDASEKKRNTNELSDPIVPVRFSSLYMGRFCEPGREGYSPPIDTIAVTYPTEPASRWPKLEPEPDKDPHALCPGEEKFKKRCFAVCFVILILLIAGFVMITIEGWMFSSTGKGLNGDSSPILVPAAMPPVLYGANLTSVPNATEVVHDNF